MNELKNPGSGFSLSWRLSAPKVSAPQLPVPEAARQLPASILMDFTMFSPLCFLPANSQSEEEEDVFGISRRRSSLGLSGYPLTEEEPGPGGPLPRALRRIISIEEDPLPQLLRGSSEQPLGKCPEEEEVSDQGVEGPLQQAPPPRLTPASPRGQPVGKEALSEVRAPPSLASSSPGPSSVSPEPNGSSGCQMQQAWRFSCLPSITGRLRV